jgi:hypothetical protein
VKDVFGNELKPGDLVAVQLERPLVWGRVERVEEGGLIAKLGAKGEPQMQLGKLVIGSVHSIDVDPRFPIAAVMALRENVSEELKPPPPRLGELI